MCEPILINSKEELDFLFKSHNAEEEKYILIQLSATWCGPCKKITMLFSRDASWIEKYNGLLKWCIIDIDKMSEDKDLLKSLPTVNSVPTFYLMKGFQSIGMIKGADVNQIIKLLESKIV